MAYTPRGAWVSTTTYTQGDEVTYSSHLYFPAVIQPEHIPSSSPTWWQMVGSGGSQTPWLSDINGAGFKLNSAGAIGIGVVASAGSPLLVAKDANGIASNYGLASVHITGFTDPNKALVLGYDTTGDYAVIGAINNTTPAFRPLILNPAGGNIGIGIAAPGGVLTANINQQQRRCHAPFGNGGDKLV